MPHYSSVSKRVITINDTFKMNNQGTTQNLAIDSMGLKVYDADP
ncbi:hypothetical protein BTN50_0425 [Candidatus Enterovibrio altilux]|uniref:Mobile element protein n=1 Tax=Candidatus Enterovibrio altilux TaxID=1927128 RepID=A0A291B7H6_9GAMM|nr:hypothetical protein BTN50_0425 [Candidatus Enterovibrio luxaltus]